MITRIDEKIEEIEEIISYLEDIKIEEFEDYLKDKKTMAASERYFEKIVEGLVDIAFLLIKEKDLKIPEEDKEAFDILKEEGIIDETLCNKLKDAKGMRNILAHEYGKVNDELVFHSVNEEIINDANKFLDCLKKNG